MANKTPKFTKLSTYTNDMPSFYTGQTVTKFVINDGGSMSETVLMAVFDNLIDEAFEADRKRGRGMRFKFVFSSFKFVFQISNLLFRTNSVHAPYDRTGTK
jgi:hypothetical protein